MVDKSPFPEPQAPYFLPRFSIAERDRRWAAVRALMAEHNIDVIIAPQNTGHSMDFQADTRYLTHCGGGGDADIAAVFPLEGDVTVIATSATPRWLPNVQDWTTDIREARRNYGRVMVERLSELDLTHNRIGITGLGEIGGTMEEDAAEYIKGMNKPVVSYIVGGSAPEGKRMGHAGAIVTGTKGSYKSKRDALEAAGAVVLDTPSDVGRAMNEALG